MMAEKPFVTTLPVFNADKPLTAALDDSRIMTWGAVVSKDGNEYRVHRLDELSAARSQFGDLITFGRLKVEGRVLQRSNVGDAENANVILSVGHGKIAEATVRAFKSSLDITPKLGDVTGTAMAWILTDSGNSFVLVGSRYVCSQEGESYDETVYVDNDGMCPVHLGATLDKR
jgi:hypothetical protein